MKIAVSEKLAPRRVFWLIFWLLVCFPVAIALFFVRHRESFVHITTDQDRTFTIPVSRETYEQLLFALL